jgi:two-component system, cell cycle response regulator DivK
MVPFAKGDAMPAKILIAEDNESNRLLIRDLLHHYGYEVYEAENGRKAVEMSREIAPDLILMDIQMPVMDGLTAMKHLKNDAATAGLMIIALTSFAMKHDREKMLAAGFDGYLAKPLDTRALPEAVQKFIKKRQTMKTDDGADTPGIKI